jgi:hypothetical protein
LLYFEKFSLIEFILLTKMLKLTGMLKKIRTNSGFSIIELVVVAAMSTILMFAGLQYLSNQIKSNNFLGFQAKREQLRTALATQVLSDAFNCGCIFAGSTPFPAAGTLRLNGFAQPDIIGRYANADCSGDPAIPNPLITRAGVDGVRLDSVDIMNISLVSGMYVGTMHVGITSSRDVIGPSQLFVKIPVAIQVTPSGGNVQLESCTAEKDLSDAIAGGAYLPEIQVVKATNGGQVAEVQCPADFTRISCMGSRQRDLRDTCDEDGCGLVGVGPVDPNGCKVKIDSGRGTSPTVWATCVRTSSAPSPVSTDPAPTIVDDELGSDPETTYGGDFTTATTPATASCPFNGITIPSGGSTTAYLASSVPSGSTCTSQLRTCTNGVLSGSYTFSTCTVMSGAPGSCAFAGAIIANGATVTAWNQGYSPPCEAMCDSEVRTCNGGVLSGSYTFTSCTQGVLPGGTVCP